MMEAPIPTDEPERLAALHAIRVLDTPAEERFDRITRTARDLFRVPIVLISLVDAHRQWFKSRTGLDEAETPRAISFCAHTILDDLPLVVENALEDSRFADNPLVAGGPNIRFYAGMPLHSLEGRKLGTLCLIDRQPRHFNAADQIRLRDMARWAERELNLALEMEGTVAEMQDSFVRLVSHELRTPVTSLMGALELIRNGLYQGEEIDTLARIANDGAGQLKRVVDDIVTLVELDAGHLDQVPIRVELSSFFLGILESLAPAAKRAGVRILLDVPAELAVMVAAKPLEKIVRSLLDNAVRFCGVDQAVSVRAACTQGGRLSIHIEDSGPGIPEEDISRLFRPFTQLDDGDNRVAGGLGISLTLSRRLATAMGGHLGYEPREGGGCRFYLELPV